MAGEQHRRQLSAGRALERPLLQHARATTAAITRPAVTPQQPAEPGQHLRRHQHGADRDARARAVSVAAGSATSRRAAAPGNRNRQRDQRQAGRRRAVLQLHVVSVSDDHLPLRPEDAQQRGVQARRRSRSIATQYETKQVFYTSKDGTRVPMFITAKKGTRARRQQSDASLRLRRIQHLRDALLLGGESRVARDGRHLRRRRTFAAAASTARNGTKPECSTRSRTCSTISSPRPNT